MDLPAIIALARQYQSACPTWTRRYCLCIAASVYMSGRNA